MAIVRKMFPTVTTAVVAMQTSTDLGTDCPAVALLVSAQPQTRVGRILLARTVEFQGTAVLSADPTFVVSFDATGALVGGQVPIALLDKMAAAVPDSTYSHVDMKARDTASAGAVATRLASITTALEVPRTLSNGNTWQAVDSTATTDPNPTLTSEMNKVFTDDPNFDDLIVLSFFVVG